MLRSSVESGFLLNYLISGGKTETQTGNLARRASPPPVLCSDDTWEVLIGQRSNVIAGCQTSTGFIELSCFERTCLFRFPLPPPPL